MFEVRTKRDLIASVAEQWKASYYSERDGWLYNTRGPDKSAIYQRLSALPANATEADITAVMGSNSWTANRCDNCGADVDVTVRLGEEPDYESATAYVCRTCLVGALDAINAERTH
jgi:hypothetical protein